MLPDIEYIEWIAGRPEAADHDLGSSDLRRTPDDRSAVIPADLTERPDPPADRSLEAQLADEYGVEPENVLVTAGATQANALASSAALRIAADDETPDEEADASAHRVLVEKPGYEPLLATPRGFGATVDRFRRPAEAGYPLDAERVGAAVRENTALVVATNRHNPSGRRADRQTLADVAGAVEDEGVSLLVDEVYAPFDDRAGEGPFGGPSAVGLPNTVVTNSLTKFLGFGGLRIGWLVADRQFVEAARSASRHVHAVAEPSRQLARRALASADELAADARERVRTNREALVEFLDAREDLSGTVEPGCSYAFLEHAAADGDAVVDAAWDRGVLVVPGRFFDVDERFRLSVAGEPAAVRAGLDALGTALDDLPTA
ncbi:pyridoxal phosphate-dependent aminotransferase [Halorussus marinus]|uniref:pyridoxal phosphate-dependent aminotransferase n=1 Tax=Halorussus marinus TaxID=2505976 RepID=UPI00106E13F0|nr:pyridoxal phosphate-dependent aminotransferase [Halorussus marinus]